MDQRTRPCEVCGTPIDPERLEVLPETRLCITHARKISALGGEFRYYISQEKLSKEGGLKKNYGGIKASKRRNDLAMEKLKARFEDEQTGPAE